MPSLWTCHLCHTALSAATTNTSSLPSEFLPMAGLLTIVPPRESQTDQVNPWSCLPFVVESVYHLAPTTNTSSLPSEFRVTAGMPVMVPPRDT